MREKKKVNWKVLILSFIAVHLTAVIGTFFTNSDTEWYDSIKPSITPPSIVFPIVWTILFILLSFSLYFAWINGKKNQRKIIALVFGINLVLNALWSYLFFGLQNPIASFCELIILWFSIVSMLIVTYKISKRSCYLLIPYFLWVSFAGILNLFIVLKI